MITQAWKEFETAFRALGEQTLGMRPIAAKTLARIAMQRKAGGPGTSTVPIGEVAPLPTSELLVHYPDDYPNCQWFWEMTTNKSGVPLVKITEAGLQYVEKHMDVFDLAQLDT